MIFEAILLGMLLGLICHETTGMNAGGIIAPGYIAFFLLEPMIILNVVLALGVTYLIIWIMSHKMFLFGRRLLFASMILGFIVHYIIQTLFQTDFIANTNILLLGALIPGEINYEFRRQGIKKTVVALTATTLMVKLGIIGITSLH